MSDLPPATNNHTSFWDFSTHLYAKPNVAAHCLQLQNDAGLDVNLVLFCVWHAYIRGHITSALLHEAITFSTGWRKSVVQPLRETRTTMKEDSEMAAHFEKSEYESYREQVKALELKAEKMQQETLQQQTEKFAPSNSAEAGAAIAMTNLAKLCDSLSINVDPNTLSCFQAIVAAKETA